MRITRVTIIKTSEPSSRGVNELLQWFGGTLGLFNLRDKDRSCFRIFIVLLKSVKGSPKGLSSDDIAERTSLSRGTVIYHLNKLMDVGIVFESSNKYFLKFDSLEEISEGIRSEVNDAFDSLSFIGRDLDRKLGLKKE